MRITLSILALLVPAWVGAQCFPEAACRYTEPPPVQVLTAGQTVSARDACGTIKKVSAAGAVTTSTVDTFTLPALAGNGCFMFVCNTGTNTITLDNNARFISFGAADVSLTANDCVAVVSNGVAWMQVAPVSAN